MTRTIFSHIAGQDGDADSFRRIEAMTYDRVMSDVDPVLQVLTAYPRIYLACHTHHAGRQSGASLTDREVLVVGHLVDGAVGVGALANHMGVTQSTMTATIDELERRGFVERHRPANDRRRVTVRATTKGLEAMAASSVLDTSRVAGVLASMSDDDRERAVEGLALLARAASAYALAVPKRHLG
jgi:DNA-binding MarR family transcriptional regulator